MRRFMVFPSIFFMSWVVCLVDRVRDSGAFSRERAPLRIKVLATILYYSDLSLMDIESIVGKSKV